MKNLEVKISRNKKQDTTQNAWSISFFSCFLFLGSFFLSSEVASAAPASLLYRHDHHLFTISVTRHPEWQGTEEKWFYEGHPIRPPSELRTDGDVPAKIPPGFVRQIVSSWDRAAIGATIQKDIASQLDRPAGSVTIDRTSTGVVLFDGIGLSGRAVDIATATELTIAALERDISDVVLPIIETQPSITVRDNELRRMGIQQVVTVGESSFTGSPDARRHNIAVGLSKFNGHVIPQGDTFSFNEVLGPVNQSTGYRRELVILGEKTLPDYGGGLCQVSTTAYRGVWEAGFPIDTRRNHSYAVRYYAPQGTDATIYPPNTDMLFTNDGPSALLIQTHVDGDDAYFIYYGTRDERESEIIGPYTWGHVEPPPDRTEYTTEIPPGTERKVGERVPGLRAAWYRVVEKDSEEVVESYYSAYEARPRYIQIGIEGEPAEVQGPIEPLGDVEG
jgi:vancomycin resistance protein YoaR